MKIKGILIIGAVAALMATGTVSHAGTISFSGHTWVIGPSGKGGPGPNNWDQDNVSVDAGG